MVEALGPRVLIAPDKFKGSLSALGVASAIATGIGRVRADAKLDLCPVADGGEGTLDAAVSAGFRKVPVDVEGPTGQLVRAAYGEREGVALVELAEAAGLARLAGDAPAPLTASTYGVGQLIDAALAAGNRTIIVAIGGSATTDGGAGLAEALGAVLLDGEGTRLDRGGGALASIGSLSIETMRARLAGVTFILASDVTNPLLGPDGAAAVFGPQKGASPGDVEVLERGLSRWSEVVAAAVGGDVSAQPGAGAAGGVGFGAMALLGASFVPGADMVLELVEFADRASQADLVITGEGSLDRQSLFGKAPIRVASAASAAGKRVVAVVGRCALSIAELVPFGIGAVYELSELEPDEQRSMGLAEDLIAATGEELAAKELSAVAGPTRSH